jgi:hypothetical protein
MLLLSLHQRWRQIQSVQTKRVTDNCTLSFDSSKKKRSFGDEISLRLQVEIVEEGPNAVDLLERISLCPLTENLSYIEPEFILLTIH